MKPAYLYYQIPPQAAAVFTCVPLNDTMIPCTPCPLFLNLLLSIFLIDISLSITELLPCPLPLHQNPPAPLTPGGQTGFLVRHNTRTFQSQYGRFLQRLKLFQPEKISRFSFFFPLVYFFSRLLLPSVVALFCCVFLFLTLKMQMLKLLVYCGDHSIHFM